MDIIEYATFRCDTGEVINGLQTRLFTFNNYFTLLYFIVDASYSDPLGDAPARPKTAARRNPAPAEDEFGDEELGDDLLPD